MDIIKNIESIKKRIENLNTALKAVVYKLSLNPTNSDYVRENQLKMKLYSFHRRLNELNIQLVYKTEISNFGYDDSFNFCHSFNFRNQKWNVYTNGFIFVNVCVDLCFESKGLIEIVEFHNGAIIYNENDVYNLYHIANNKHYFGSQDETSTKIDIVYKLLNMCEINLYDEIEVNKLGEYQYKFGIFETKNPYIIKNGNTIYFKDGRFVDLKGDCVYTAIDENGKIMIEQFGLSNHFQPKKDLKLYWYLIQFGFEFVGHPKSNFYCKLPIEISSVSIFELDKLYKDDYLKWEIKNGLLIVQTERIVYHFDSIGVVYGSGVNSYQFLSGNRRDLKRYLVVTSLTQHNEMFDGFKLSPKVYDYKCLIYDNFDLLNPILIDSRELSKKYPNMIRLDKFS